MPPIVSPRWLPNGEAFWYRCQLTPTQSEFIFVDVDKRTRQRAFDHERLAVELSKQSGQTIDSAALPFTWIELALDSSTVCFRHGGQKWQFDRNGKLSTWGGNFTTPDPRALLKEVPSQHSRDPITLTFINHTNVTLSLFWIDWECKKRPYSDIGAGKSERQLSYVGHVWRLEDRNSGKLKALYSGPNAAFDTIIIDDDTWDNVTEQWDSKGEEEDKVEVQPSELKAQTETETHLFIRDSNVWIGRGTSGESQVSTNGCEENSYTDTRLYKSQDGQFVVAWQYIREQDHKIHLIESSPEDQLEPKLKTLQYLKPGDRVRIDRPRLFDLMRCCEVTSDDTLFKNPFSLTNMGWSKDGKEYRFLFNERGHKNLRVVGISRDGVVRALVEESSVTFIDYSNKLYFLMLEESGEMLWASERDGYNHLYLYDLETGTVKNQITTGQWNVNLVDSVDEKSRRIWIRGYGLVPGEDPYHAHLAVVNFDGSGFRVLTDGDGTHTWLWSPNKRYFIDTWSRVDEMPQTVLRDAESGEQPVHLEGVDRTGPPTWNRPERFVAPGRDGKTLIYGIIIRPTEFDPAKKYPILENIYAGPGNFHTPKAFSLSPRQCAWADQGYVFVQLDGMGTNWRGKAFQDVCYKNLKDAGIPDRIAWIKAAAETRPWMDLSRVGIRGGSAGGQNAVAALIFHGDFYKAAVADSGCHDNRMDKLRWNEQWMGYPVDEAYEKSSNVVHAAKLNGALMLMVGEMDDNVDPSSTFQLVNALNKACKEYELVFIPGGKHNCGHGSYGVRRQESFFRRHLKML